jgi:hypothetical protein
MPDAKILSYRYIDNDEAEEDDEFDLSGILKMPRRGDIIYRREKPFKVTGVYAAADQPVPKFRIYLADMTKTRYLN